MQGAMQGGRALLGIGLLLLGSTAAGLVVLVPAVPVAAGAVGGLVLVAAGLWLLVTDVRDRLLGLRVSVRADPVLQRVVPRRYGDDASRAWDLLTLAADGPEPGVERLRVAAEAAADVDDLAVRLGLAS